MAPNLYLATRSLFTPHKWRLFEKRSETPETKGKCEHWDSPVPGTYNYKPGRGWYLTQRDDGEHLDRPQHVKYSKVLQQYLLQSDYESRKRFATINDEDGRVKRVGFFRFDEVAWVQCYDELGEFVPGPYKRFCIDQHTGNFREMLKGDDPGWQSRRSSRQSMRSRRSRESSYTSDWGSRNSSRAGLPSRSESPSKGSSRPESPSRGRNGSFRQPARHSIAAIPFRRSSSTHSFTPTPPLRVSTSGPSTRMT